MYSGAPMSHVSDALAGAYRRTTRAPGPEELVEVEPGVRVPRFVYDWSRAGPDEARTFLDRLPVAIELQNRTVLALGRGAADLGIVVAQRSPRRVVAFDMAARRLILSQIRLAEDPPEAPIEIEPFVDGLASLGDQRFDVVLAADAFRRYGAPRSSRHLEQLVAELAARLEPGGLLGTGFSPPWKAPFGGGVDSRLPWAHLIFPEPVIFAEFRRVRSGNEARTFDDIGVNRITLARFRRAMVESGLECVALETNVSDSRAVAVMRTLSRLKPVQEYFTQNVYGVWRRR